MERKKQYNEKQVEQDLYQYEMGIELGADVESEKQQHLNEYQRENRSQDGNFERNQRQNNQNQQRNEFHSLNQNNQNRNQNNNQNRNNQNNQNNQNQRQYQQNNRNNFR